MKRFAGALAVVLLVCLAGCGAAPSGRPGQEVVNQEESSTSLPPHVSPAEVDSLLEAARSRPFRLILRENDQTIIDMGALPNGDCHMREGGNPFAKRGLQTWHLDRSGNVVEGPFWDTSIPQLPLTHVLEAGCRERYPGFAALAHLRDRLERAGDVWSAAVTTADKDHLPLHPMAPDTVRRFEVTTKQMDGAILPVAYRLEFDGAPPHDAVIEWGDAGFPSLPDVEGLGLQGIPLGALRDDVEGPPNGRPLPERRKNPDGTEWARDPERGPEVKYDAAGQVVAIRKVRWNLVNGLTIGTDGRDQVEKRFGPPAAATDRELRYDYPGGYRLIFELTDGKVTSVLALAPGESGP